jgi:hypothetical protein
MTKAILIPKLLLSPVGLDVAAEAGQLVQAD